MDPAVASIATGEAIKRAVRWVRLVTERTKLLPQAPITTGTTTGVVKCPAHVLCHTSCCRTTIDASGTIFAPPYSLTRLRGADRGHCAAAVKPAVTVVALEFRRHGFRYSIWWRVSIIAARTGAAKATAPCTWCSQAGQSKYSIAQWQAHVVMALAAIAAEN